MLIILVRVSISAWWGVDFLKLITRFTLRYKFESCLKFNTPKLIWNKVNQSNCKSRKEICIANFMFLNILTKVQILTFHWQLGSNSILTPTNHDFFYVIRNMIMYETSIKLLIKYQLLLKKKKLSQFLIILKPKKKQDGL